MIVAVYCPGTTELLAVSVSELDVVVGLGLHDAVTPLGRPETERFTPPAKPYSELTLTYDVPELPWPIVILPGLERVKLGA